MKWWRDLQFLHHIPISNVNWSGPLLVTTWRRISCPLQISSARSSCVFICSSGPSLRGKDLPRGSMLRKIIGCNYFHKYAYIYTHVYIYSIFYNIIHINVCVWLYMWMCTIFCSTSGRLRVLSLTSPACFSAKARIRLVLSCEAVAMDMSL
jgi:hypothetical protein